MKRFKFFMAGSLILSVALACSKGHKDDGVTARIGYIGYLSGGGAAYGIAQHRGLELAQDEINAANEGKLKIVLIAEDSQGKKESAINAINKLINEDKVVAIIGPTLSSEMFAIGKIATEAETPIFAISNTVEGITDIGSYVFRNSLPESISIPHTIKDAVKKFPVKKVAFLYCKNDDFSVGGFQTMKKTAAEMGLTNLGEETFSTGDVDFAAQVTKVKSMNPDLVFVSALYKEGSLVLKKLREMGVKVPIVGGNGFNNPKVFELAQDAAENLMVATPFDAKSKKSNVESFVTDFKKKYGVEPDQFAAQAYDALYIITEALVRTNTRTDRKALRDELAKLKNFPGVTGNLSFDDQRNPISEPIVMIAKGGKYIPLTVH